MEGENPLEIGVKRENLKHRGHVILTEDSTVQRAPVTPSPEKTEVCSVERQPPLLLAWTVQMATLPGSAAWSLHTAPQHRSRTGLFAVTKYLTKAAYGRAGWARGSGEQRCGAGGELGGTGLIPLLPLSSVQRREAALTFKVGITLWKV